MTPTTHTELVQRSEHNPYTNITEDTDTDNPYTSITEEETSQTTVTGRHTDNPYRNITEEETPQTTGQQSKRNVETSVMRKFPYVIRVLIPVFICFVILGRVFGCFYIVGELKELKRGEVEQAQMSKVVYFIYFLTLITRFEFLYYLLREILQ